MIKRILLTAFFFVCLETLLPCSAFAGPGIESLIADARAREIAHDPQWHAFLHYDSTAPLYTEETRSLGTKLFLSPLGGSDPIEELDATLRAFAAPASLGDEHARCRFPARFKWLSSMLQFPADLPQPNCARFDEWYSLLKPAHVTVIFPAAFLNNPASAFGHTFIRLDQANQTEETRLLAYAADFAAATQGEDALSYAVKGVFGGYQGFYSVTPYYKKVTKYSDLENRDIWEYELSLEPAEVDLLTLHLWELREVPFTYYYFDENCSYHILALIQVARPTLRLVESFNTWVIPIDTLRELLLRENILNKATFRPSAATKLHHRIKHTTDAAQVESLHLSQNGNTDVQDTGLAAEEVAEAYDLAYDVHTYERIKKRDDSDATKQHAWKLLSKRSTLPKKRIPEMTTPPRPEYGHKTALISTGAGAQSGKVISEVIVRPAFHALTDNAVGYLPGAQIKFFETVMRGTESEGISLERFTALNITSLTPRDRFFKPMSWQVTLEGRRARFSAENDSFISELNAGGGRSYAFGDSVLGYGLLNGDLELSGSLDDNYAFGGGPRMGLIAAPYDWMATEAMGEMVYIPFGEAHNRYRAMVSQRFTLSEDLAVRLDFEQREEFDYTTQTAMARLELFFSP